MSSFYLFTLWFHACPKINDDQDKICREDQHRVNSVLLRLLSGQLSKCRTKGCRSIDP